MIKNSRRTSTLIAQAIGALKLALTEDNYGAQLRGFTAAIEHIEAARTSIAGPVQDSMKIDPEVRGNAPKGLKAI